MLWLLCSCVCVCVRVCLPWNLKKEDRVYSICIMSSEMSGRFCSSTVLCFVLSIFGARESNTRTDRYSAFISQLWKFSPLISCSEWQIANIPTLSCPKYFPFCSTASVTMAGGYATVILKTAVCKSYMQYMHIHWGALKKLNEAWHK